MPRIAKAEHKRRFDVRGLARGYTETAIRTLVGIMTNENASHADRRGCANDLIAIGHGRPSAMVDIKIEDARPESVQKALEQLFTPGDSAKVIDGAHEVVENKGAEEPEKS